MLHNFNNIDLAVLIILLLSALTAFFRGFVKEILSILGWVLAAFVTSRGLVFAQPLFRNWLKMEIMADFIASSSLFIGTSIIWTVLTGMMTKKVRRSTLSSIDKFLGLVFGLVRAVLLITLAYIFISFLFSKEEMPKMITTAKSLVYIEPLAEILSKFAPEELLAIKEKIITTKETEADSQDPLYQKLLQPSVKDQAEDFKGYNDTERESLDDLFEQNN